MAHAADGAPESAARGHIRRGRAAGPAQPRVGDVFLCKDCHHTGIVSRVFQDGHFDTIEGNAGPATDSVVHGVRNGSSDPGKGSYVFWTAIRP